MTNITLINKEKHLLYIELAKKTGVKYESIRTYFWKKGLDIQKEAHRKQYLAMSKAKSAYLAYSQV